MSLHDAQLEENLVLPLRRSVEVWDALEEPQQSVRLLELREAVREALKKFDAQPRTEQPYSGEKSLAEAGSTSTKQGSSESYVGEADDHCSDDH